LARSCLSSRPFGPFRRARRDAKRASHKHVRTALNTRRVCCSNRAGPAGELIDEGDLETLCVLAVDLSESRGASSCPTSAPWESSPTFGTVRKPLSALGSLSACGRFNSSLAHFENVALTRVNSRSHCRARSLAQHMHNISGCPEGPRGHMWAEGGTRAARWMSPPIDGRARRVQAPTSPVVARIFGPQCACGPRLDPGDASPPSAGIRWLRQAQPSSADRQFSRFGDAERSRVRSTSADRQADLDDSGI
jgi:hypothetical protein